MAGAAFSSWGSTLLYPPRDRGHGFHGIVITETGMLITSFGLS